MTNYRFSVKSKLLQMVGPGKSFDHTLTPLFLQKLLSLCFFLFVLFLLGCQSQYQSDEAALFQRKDSVQTSIGFVNALQDTDKLSILDYLYYYNGAGVAVGDVNNDGFADVLFVSNRSKNKLYLNKGKQGKLFEFEDISDIAGIEGFSDWQTGVSMVDINGDGWLDIYICAVGDYKGLEGTNELYINNGPNTDGVVTFTEKAAEYGLNFTGFSTQAAFFDYDKDGDLDMYLLNHAVHTSLSYGRVSARGLKNNESGDVLFENQLISNGIRASEGTVTKFKDVSEQSGIYQAPMGYGLGIVVADFNNDGWDDIYVANDFHEDDYYYINNGNGTFTESVKEHFRHLSRFSMGCDAADINNDGFLDLMTLDMYPEDEQVVKASMGEDPFDIFLYKLNFGFYNQYSRNCLQLNLSGQKFSDIGAMAGIAATDWSWSTLMADFDNDGQKDIFVANGIVRRPNDLDYIKFVSNDSVRFQSAGLAPKSIDKSAIALMPEGKVHNYIFRGTAQMQFEDKSIEWGMGNPGISNGAVYTDLDNDGDLDLITNNINEPAGIYQNTSEKIFQNNYLKVKLEGAQANTFGIGGKVILKHQGKLQVQQLMPTRGFLSSVEPVLTFGLGKHKEIDTLMVVWGDQKVEIRTKVPVNTTLTFNQTAAAENVVQLYQQFFSKPSPLFEELSKEYSITYQHQENRYYDFYRESLMPFQVSTEGPKLAVGDVNGDGLEDFYVGGAKWQPGKLFIQKEGNQFKPSNEQVFQADSTYEDVDAVFFDADGDGHLDLYVVSGGNEFYGKMEQLFDRLYLNDGKGNFSRALDKLPLMYGNKSCVRPVDLDKDGDIDLFVGGRVVGYRYGETPDSYLLINDGNGKFSDQTDQLAPELRKAGMLTDAQWIDYDSDGDIDLVVVGDWMSIKVYENQGNKLTDVTNKTGLENSNGFWQTIKAGDFDGDGDTDFIVGNLGTNTKFRKNNKAGLLMYVKDIDENDILDHILAYQLGEQWYPVASKDELGKQLPLISKKYSNYKSFAGKTVEEIFDKGELKDAPVLSVKMFESVYLENLGNKQFRIHALPEAAQVSKIFALHVEDLDQDNKLDVLIGGNYYGVSTYQGRYDGSYGLILKGNGNGSFSTVLPTDGSFVLEGEVRDIKSLRTGNGSVLLVARNNLPLQVFRNKKNAPRPNQPGDFNAEFIHPKGK
jgi:hypothetical protein